MIKATGNRARSLRLATGLSAIAASFLWTMTAAAQGPAEAEDNSQDIVVTAQKRAERLLDVPAAVSAVTSETLAKTNSVRLQDYYSSVPGVNMAMAMTGEPVLVIRGISTGTAAGNPTVAIVVDDVPFGSSSGYTGGGLIPDFDPSDLQRIEVLRGPQGTLYGASSIGGLLKFVTADPSIDHFYGRVQAGVTAVRHGGDPGFSFRGSLNAPLGETLAVRLSGFTRRDPGFIDNPLTERRDINVVDMSGGMISALWRPSSDVSLKLSALHQQIKADGSPQEYVLPGLDEYEQNAPPDAGRINKRITLLSTVLKIDVDPVEFTSVTGYSRSNTHTTIDFGQAFGGLSEAEFGVAGAYIRNSVRTSKFSQELRLDGGVGSAIDWQLGGFFTHEDTKFQQLLDAVHPKTGEFAGRWLDAQIPASFREIAAFGSLVWRLSDRFDIRAGARWSHNRQTYSEINTGPYTSLIGLPSPIITPYTVTRDQSFTYTVTPRLKLGGDVMIYASLATGYRPGGPNPTYAAFNLPPSFEPDTTQNYELGIKGTAFDRLLTFDASIYRIDWDDIQLLSIDPVSSANYYVNAGGARSEGVEISLGLRPATGLNLSAWATWNAAELTTDLPAGSTTVGLRGDRLPFSSRFSANGSISQNIALGNDWAADFGVTLSYVGKRIGQFTATPERQVLGSYVKLDVSMGVKNDIWEANIFVTNLTSSRGRLDGGLGTYSPAAFTMLQPRSVGLSIAQKF